MKNDKLRPETDFNEVVKNPLKWFGMIYPYFIILLLVTGIYFVKNLTQISFNEQNAVKDNSSQYVKDVEMKKGGIVPSIKLDELKNPDEEILKKGEALYQSTCVTCHGTDGKGDGAAGAALNPKPRNFHQKEGWTNGREFPEMFKTLQEGIIKNGMAAYDNVPVADRVGVIYYIRKMTGGFPPVTDEQIQELDQTYNLSAGTVIPNQIPVEEAMNKLIEEHASKASN